MMYSKTVHFILVYKLHLRWEFIKENKKVRKQDLDQETDQENKKKRKKTRTRPRK